jgi:hypothetical protein
LIALFVLGRLPVEVLYADVIGEMVVKFWEQAKWCLGLKAFGLRICGLILGRWMTEFI